MQNETLIAVDLAKNVFELVVSTRPGSIDSRHRLNRDKFLGFFVNRPPATVIMEACGTAHSWGREIRALGHHVVLLPARQVRPYVVRNKTDRTDVKGMLEAFRNEDIRPVPIKTLEQQTIGSIHRVRSAWSAERTAKINTLRGLLRELGLVIPVGSSKVIPHVRGFIGDPEVPLPNVIRNLFGELCDEIREIDRRIKLAEDELDAIADDSPIMTRLRTVPGIGLLTATALVAFVGDIQRFPTGRHFASFLGLTPREYSSGSRRSLGRISKRGDTYLRMLLVHGARSVLVRSKTMVAAPDRLRTWALRLETTSKHNKAVVALANKLARIAWAVWKHDRDFHSMPAAA